MAFVKPTLVAAALVAVSGVGAIGGAFAQSQTDIADTVVGLITNLNPKVRYDEEDIQQEVIVARRIDLVDASGVIRMTLAGQLPNPVVDGVEYRRSSPVGGIMLRDQEGNERGGFAYHDALKGPILALDQPGNEGAGFVIRPDGGSMMLLGNAGDRLTDARLPGRSLPVPGSGPRSAMVAVVDPSGDQSFTLSDGTGRPRLRLVTDDAGGRIEFLDEAGRVTGTVDAQNVD